MLNDNIKAARKAKGLSQEELAAKLNVVRQTISKWEKGTSVPDAEMLIEIANALDISVSDLLGEPCPAENNSDTLKALAEKLEVMNEQYARNREKKRKIGRMISLALVIWGVIFLVDRVWTAGFVFRAITNIPLGDNPDIHTTVGAIPQSAYNMAFSLCARIVWPPVLICALGAIGVYITKTE